jgi:hypothetical protein
MVVSANLATLNYSRGSLYGGEVTLRLPRRPALALPAVNKTVAAVTPPARKKRGPMSEETKQKISQSNKGKTRSKKIKLQISQPLRKRLASVFGRSFFKKWKLAAEALSPKVGIDPDTLIQNAINLDAIIPSGDFSLKYLNTSDLMRLAAGYEEVPAKLIQLREALPSSVDLDYVLCNYVEVLLLPIHGEYSVEHGYQAVLHKFENEIGEEGVHEMLENAPQLLDPTIFKAVLHAAEENKISFSKLVDTLSAFDSWLSVQPLQKTIELIADDLSLEFGIAADILVENTAKLEAILPGGAEFIKKLEPEMIVKLASQYEALPAKLLSDKEALPPSIDYDKLVTKWPEILLLPTDAVKSRYNAVLEKFKS